MNLAVMSTGNDSKNIRTLRSNLLAGHDVPHDVTSLDGANTSNHHIQEQINLIDVYIKKQLGLARMEKSAVSNMMNQVFNEVSTILEKCPMKKFPETITKTKRDLLLSKLYLGSEICNTLETVIPKCTNFLKTEGGMVEKEININIDHLKASVLDYTKEIMQMKELHNITTHGNIAFDAKKRYPQMPAIFKTHRPEKTPKIPELQKFLDFINLMILKIELVAKNGGQDLSDVVNFEAK